VVERPCGLPGNAARAAYPPDGRGRGAGPKVDESSIKDISGTQVVWIKDLLRSSPEKEWNAVKAARALKVRGRTRSRTSPATTNSTTHPQGTGHQAPDPARTLEDVRGIIRYESDPPARLAPGSAADRARGDRPPCAWSLSTDRLALDLAL